MKEKQRIEEPQVTTFHQEELVVPLALTTTTT